MWLESNLHIVFSADSTSVQKRRLSAHSWWGMNLDFISVSCPCILVWLSSQPDVLGSGWPGLDVYFELCGWGFLTEECRLFYIGIRHLPLPQPHNPPAYFMPVSLVAVPGIYVVASVWSNNTSEKARPYQEASFNYYLARWFCQENEIWSAFWLISRES